MKESNPISTLKLITSKHEAGNVMTFVFEIGEIKWTAGQFQKYTLPQAGTNETETERFFTIASAPSEGVIRISTRISDSKFKQALKALVAGDTIQRQDIDGDFIWEDDPSADVVLIAGGIGVTPLRSILLERHVTEKNLNATLLYFNRTNEIPFLEEFKSLAEKHPEFILLPIIGEDMTADTILTRIPEAAKQTFYLSGPEPMVESIGAELIKRGINLKQDWFPGYDEKNY